MTKKWNPPSEGSTARGAMPASCFLVPGQKKYPYKTRSGGKWVVSRSGLKAAMSRAGQQHDASVEAKAKRLYSKYFGGGK